MMAVKKTCLLFALAIFGHAQASDWRYLSLDNPDGRTMQIDFESIAIDGPYRKAWIFYNFPQGMMHEGRQYKSLLSLQYYDCKSKTQFTRQTISYAEENRVGAVIHNLIDPLRKEYFRDIVPDSAGEIVWQTLCSKPQK